MSMVSTDEGTDRCMFVLSPNPAPPWPDIRLFFIVLATPSLLVASGFAWLGFWPILPFAGLELLGLAAALYATAKRAELREVVRISKDKIEIEKGRRHPEERVEMRSTWAKVLLKRPNTPLRASRLVISSHGSEVEVGPFLVEEERRQLASALRKAISSVTR